MQAKSWKTTSSGLLAIIAGASGLYFSIKNATLDETKLVLCAGSLLTGIGLIFAKDKNVTGGTKDNGKRPGGLTNDNPE